MFLLFDNSTLCLDAAGDFPNFTCFERVLSGCIHIVSPSSLWQITWVGGLLLYKGLMFMKWMMTGGVSNKEVGICLGDLIGKTQTFLSPRRQNKTKPSMYMTSIAR